MIEVDLSGRVRERRERTSRRIRLWGTLLCVTLPALLPLLFLLYARYTVEPPLILYDGFVATQPVYTGPDAKHERIYQYMQWYWQDNNIDPDTIRTPNDRGARVARCAYCSR